MSYIGNTVENQNYVPAIDYFNGDGSTVAFTLSRPVASVAAVQAVISNVPQNPGSAFTVSGSTITFTSAPPSGTANIYVYYTSPNTQVVQPGQGTVGTTQIADGAVTTVKHADASITQPKIATGVAGTGPAFSAYLSTNQTISQNTLTKVALNTESFDTASCFDTTNNRFTPNVAGYYAISGQAYFLATSGRSYGFTVRVYKNGSLINVNVFTVTSLGSFAEASPSISNVVYMNGSTDYLELYVYHYDYTSGGSVTLAATSTYTFFSGALVRAA